MEQTVAPDGGVWAWLAVFGCFMGNVIGDGVMYSFGVFLPKFKEHFQCGSAEISIVSSVQMGVTFASGPIASYLTNKLGWRLTTIVGSMIGAAGLMLSAVAPSVYFLYISAGVLIGLGLGIIYLPRLDCITQYFTKKRPFVTGLAICGSGIGTFLFAPLTDWLLANTDWQVALLILGGICLFNSFFGLLFKPLPKIEIETDEMEVMLEKEDGKKQTTNEEKETVKEMLLLMRDWVFLMFAVSNFLTSLGYPIPYTFVPDNAQQLGLHPTQGSFLVGLIGISNTVARLVLGILSQKLNRLFLYNTCLVICGVSMALTNYFHPMLVAISGAQCSPQTSSMITMSENATLLLQENIGLAAATNSSLIPLNVEDGVDSLQDVSWICNPYSGQLVYAILYGITSAAYVLLTTLVLADLLGADKFTNSFGLLLLFQGVATFFGPPIVGFMFDQYNSYNPGFILMGVMIALSGLMLYPIPCIKRRLEKSDENQWDRKSLKSSIVKSRTDTESTFVTDY